MSLEKRGPRGFYRYSFTLNGKRYRHSTGTSNRTEALRAQAEAFARAVIENDAIIGEPLSLLEIAELEIEERVENTDDDPELKKRARYTAMWTWYGAQKQDREDMAIFDYFDPEMDPSTLTSRHIKNFIIEQAKIGRSQDSAKKRVAAIKRAIMIGLAHRSLFRDPVVRWPPVKKNIWARNSPTGTSKSAQAGKPHDFKTIKRWHASLREGKSKNIATFLMLTGMRVGEAMRVRFSMLNVIEVEGVSYDVLELSSLITKSREERSVPVAHDLMEMLDRIRAYNDVVGITGDDADLIFGKFNVQKTWDRAVERIGYDRTITPRDFRHWVARNSAQYGDLEAARAALGHKSSTTTQRYLGVTTRDMAAVGEHIAGLVSELKPARLEESDPSPPQETKKTTRPRYRKSLFRKK